MAAKGKERNGEGAEGRGSSDQEVLFKDGRRRHIYKLMREIR